MNFGGIYNNPNSNGNLEMNDNELNENSSLLMEPNDEDNSRLMKLNDDCLLEIMSYLNIFDLMNIQGIHPRLDSVIEMHNHKYGEFSFQKEYERTKNSRIYQNSASIIKFLGANLRSFALNYAELNFLRGNANEVLRALLTNCPNLETLKCQDYNIDLSYSLENLNPQLRQLKSFSFCNGNNILDDELAIILINTPILEELNISENRIITCECLKNIRTLRSLDVSGCNNLQPECLINALQQNMKLRELCLDDSNEINQNVIDSLTGCHEIEFLSLDISYIYSRLLNFEPIAKLPCLKKLHLVVEGSNQIDSLLEELSKKNILEELSLICDGEDQTIKCISKLTALKSLTICSAISCDESLKMLKTLTNLEVLRIPFQNELSTETIMDVIKCCYKIKSLDIEYLNMNLLKKLYRIWTATPDRPKLRIFASMADFRIKSTNIFHFLNETKSVINLKVHKWV